METDAPPARNGTGDGPDHRVTILVADDNERFRSGIVRALDRRPGVVVVGDVENGALALDDARALRPDVVLADARMPLMDGLDVARAVASDRDLGRTRVVILSARHDQRLCDDAVAAGAIGCLDKGDSRREICDAVLQLAASTARS
jgi:DNA-binding NarL/FixJ family response regulator